MENTINDVKRAMVGELVPEEADGIFIFSNDVEECWQQLVDPNSAQLYFMTMKSELFEKIDGLELCAEDDEKARNMAGSAWGVMCVLVAWALKDKRFVFNEQIAKIDLGIVLDGEAKVEGRMARKTTTSRVASRRESGVKSLNQCMQELAQADRETNGKTFQALISAAFDDIPSDLHHIVYGQPADTQREHSNKSSASGMPSGSSAAMSFQTTNTCANRDDGPHPPSSQMPSLGDSQPQQPYEGKGKGRAPNQ